MLRIALGILCFSYLLLASAHIVAAKNSTPAIPAGFYGFDNEDDFLDGIFNDDPAADHTQDPKYTSICRTGFVERFERGACDDGFDYSELCKEAALDALLQIALNGLECPKGCRDVGAGRPDVWPPTDPKVPAWFAGLAVRSLKSECTEEEIYEEDYAVYSCEVKLCIICAK